LIEVVVTMLAVSIMLVSLHAGFYSGFAVMQETREDLRATQILMQQLEALRLCSWGQLSNCPITFTEYYDPYGTTNSTGGTAYSGQIQVSSPDSVPTEALYRTNMYLVTVTVNWTNYSGGKSSPRNRQMQTHAALCGLQNYIWGAVQ
jgi:type II secretory pathway pseudopilin PulG